jgi:hypothetical protein
MADSIDDQDYTFLEEQLSTFNMAITGHSDARNLALIVRATRAPVSQACQAGRGVAR